MNLSKIKPGNNPPEDINVVIEIPMNSNPIKYEVDKETNALWIDRFLGTPMFYPANYGFVPNTLADDGDPLDVLVISPYPLPPATVINARPIGILVMSDESGEDAKVIAVPNYKITPLYDNVQEITDLPQSLVNQIEHFFEHYKDLEEGKWVKIDEWKGSDFAKDQITRFIQEK